MMKKLWAVIISASVISAAIPVLASDEADFIVVDGMITEYTGSDSYVEVPACIDGVEIAGVESHAFEGNESIETVVIKDGIEVIQPYAFSDCYNLKTVICPDSLLVIGLDAFNNCGELNDLRVADTTDVLMAEPAQKATVRDTKEASYTDENGYTASGGTITAYTGEDTELVIPSEINGVMITAIGADAFTGNISITSVTIPDTVTSIGSNAFKDCTALSEVELPSKLSSVGSYVFSGCTSLKAVEIPGTLKKMGTYMFYGCSALESAVLNEGVTNTGNYAFYDCRSLKNIELPSTVTTISVWSLGFCENLSACALPLNLKTLDSASFYYCKLLDNVEMSSKVTTLGTHCFRECRALKNIKLSDNITAITYRAFHKCGFSNLVLPGNLKTIDEEAFYNCSKLKSLYINSNVTSVGKQAFYGCSALENVVICNGNTSFGDDVFLLSSGTQSKKVNIYAPEDSKAKTYSQNNSLAYKPIVALNEAVAGSADIGTIGTINYPFTDSITSFGAKYIPKKLYDEDSDDYLDISYTNAAPQNGNTYLTVMTDVPEEALAWTYKVFPYLTLADGTEITGAVKEFTVAEIIMTITGEESSHEME